MGLKAFSTAMEDDMVALLDEMAAERGPSISRSDVIRECVEIGMPIYRARTARLKTISAAVVDDTAEAVAV